MKFAKKELAAAKEAINEAREFIRLGKSYRKAIKGKDERAAFQQGSALKESSLDLITTLARFRRARESAAYFRRKIK